MNHVIKMSVLGSCELVVGCEHHTIKSLEYTISGNGSTIHLELLSRLRAIPQTCSVILPDTDTPLHLVAEDVPGSCALEPDHLHLLPAGRMELKKLIRYVESYANHLSKSVPEK